MAVPTRPSAGSPAPNRLGRGLLRGFLRGVLALLVLACALLAGPSQDRVLSGARGEAGLSATVASGHSHAAAMAGIAMGDPDDGFDDAVRMGVPAVASRRPSARVHATLAASGETAAPILLERPPRLPL